MVELEDRSRRHNLRIDGIKEEPNETWEACEKKIQDIIADKMGIESDVEIDRCHRIGPRKTKTGQNRDRPRTVVCRLNRFKDKQRILNNAKKLKNTGIYIYEDFSKDTMELRKSLWEQALEYLKQNKFACLNYRSIIVRDHNGVR